MFLNGKPFGRSVNMFRQVVCNVQGVLKAGTNTLRVLIKSPTAYAASQAKRGKYRIDDRPWIWQTGEQRPTFRPWIRKVQCHFGWDWGLYLATSGIWQSCRLECVNGPRITAITVVQDHRLAGGLARRSPVELAVTTHLNAAHRSAGTLRISCGGQTVNIAVKMPSGEKHLTVKLKIENPVIWWPAGHGEQHLYPLTVEWLDESGEVQSQMTRRIGLRTVELVRKPDHAPNGQPGESFYFRVNGRPIYAKGANWIPADQLVDRCTEEVNRHLLQSMVQANMNIIRVWGGGWYEQDIFYDLCDELGLMVWQDFMMACALYPDTEEFIGELKAEATYQVRRLHAHPCIVLWCGDNEDAEAVWKWWKDSPKFKTNVQIYKKVMTALKKTVEAEDTTRIFWLSSPSNNDFNGDCTNPNRGDVHYWTVWHGRQPFNNYLMVKPRFASEFGFQSFPEPRTIRAVMPADQLNASSRVMEHHQRSPDGNMLMTNTMAREMPLPRDFDAYCWVSQINQALAIRTAVEHWRRLRPWCMGTIYWQINDLWPVASWSSIDYHGRWKVLHHFAQRFFSPLLASIVHQDGKVAVWATSDLPHDLKLRGELEVVTWQGETISKQRLTGHLKAGESKPLAEFTVDRLLRNRAEPHEVCLFVRLDGGETSHENFATLVPWKWVTLPRPSVSLQLRDGIELIVQSEQITPFFHAELCDLEGHFDDDWQVLRPGETYKLKWIPHVHRSAEMPNLQEARRRLKTLSLYDTYEHY